VLRASTSSAKLCSTGYTNVPPLPAQYTIYGSAFSFGLACFTQQIARRVTRFTFGANISFKADGYAVA